MKRKRVVSLKQAKARIGYVFVLPTLIGVVLFFGYPMIRSLAFSFSSVGITEKGIALAFAGFGNYQHALFVDANYREIVARSLLDTLINVPVITFFSFFVATLLNQKFRGRFLVRTIFFLPIVMASSALMALDQGDLLQTVMGSAQGFKESAAFGGGNRLAVLYSLIEAGLPRPVVEYIVSATARIFDIVMLSGVQVLIFLAGLQSIPRSVYEAAMIEGSTAWDNYWKITFPMISPLMLTAVLYTVIDSFTAAGNETLAIIQNTAFRNQNFGLSAAMSWLYFLLIGLLVGILALLLTRWVFYYDKP